MSFWRSGVQRKDRRKPSAIGCGQCGHLRSHLDMGSPCKASDLATSYIDAHGSIGLLEKWGRFSSWDISSGGLPFDFKLCARVLHAHSPDDGKTVAVTEPEAITWWETSRTGAKAAAEVRQYASSHNIRFYGTPTNASWLNRIECREICPLEIAAKYQFTPCMTLSLLKDQGYPAVCQTDINALIPMMALSYLGRRSVYMGNPVLLTSSIVKFLTKIPRLSL